MKKLLLLLFVLIAYTAQAQTSSVQPCGFDIMHKRMLLADSNYAKHVQAFDNRWAQMQNNSNQSLVYNGYGSEYVIPVVVHVIHTGGSVGTIYNPSTATIEAAIEYLNETYAASYASYPDTNSGGVRYPVTFKLAQRTSTCGTTSGIIRVNGTSLTNYSSNGVNASSTSGVDEADLKALSRWDSRDYYNIWVVNKIDGNDGTSGSFTAGYAYFPGVTDTLDGTVILATRMAAGLSTLPHEIGHAFNLYHTFEGDNNGGSCPSNTSCTTQGDRVCDTDPHIRNASTCPSNSATNSCTGLAWSNNYTHKNIMDYSSCRDRFTAGQRTRWLTALTTERPGLASSQGAVAPPTTTTASATCTTTISTGSTLTTAQSANIGPTQVVLNDLTSNSGGYTRDHFQNYIDRSCEQWAHVTQGESYTLSVNTQTNLQRVQVYIDYNGNGTFVSGEKVYDHTSSLSSNQDETHATTYTVPTSGLTTCSPLRMRVLSDFYTVTPVSNGCGTMTYGQAEDFTVYVKPIADTVTMTNTITSGSNPTCTTGSVTFTASASRTLTSPSYEWYRNSQPVGSNSSTYSVSNLSAGTYYVQCKVKYTGTCGSDSAFTNIITLTVNNSSVTPSVSIASNQGTSICNGTSVTFTATPTNGGTAPTYEWKKNGSNISGATGSTYTTTTLANNDQITCVMTSNASCVSPTTATSSGITMSVTPSVTPSVSIVSSQGTSICSGTSVTFTATPTNGGTTPTYQWKKNGTNISGATGSTYTTTTLVNNDQITCVMTSNASCATTSTATSSAITMTVATPSTPSVSISSGQGTTICLGTSVTFTATPTNGGTTPTYQWKKNGSNISGATSSTYTTTTLANNDVITCTMTSNASCVSPTTATSSGITMTVTANVTPSVSIASNQGSTICSGTSVTFTATPTNGGTTPTYQWKKNGTNISGATGSTYTTTTLANNDQITCVLTSNANCASPTTATSAAITMTISTSVTPTVSISSNQGTTICSGTSVTFTATPTNGGTTPTYQWKKNGTNISGATSSTYTTSTIANNDVFTCVLTSSSSCASPTTATSSGLTMTITTPSTPSVSIAASTSATICSGTSVTFTATPTNGGTTPTYQWKKNGTNISGATSSIYTTTTLANNDQITCVMNSNASCVSPATATSSAITMTVNTNLTPSVSIASNQGSTICSGTSVTFTATPTNGGTTPTYQWKKNGTNISGATNSTYTTSTIANGDIFTCVLTSSETCVTAATATSSGITMTVTTSVTPSVSITSNQGSTICAGTSVTFTATPTNGGGTPSYQWKKNGSNISGATNSTYATTTLANNDVITCELTTSATCATTSTATSSGITMTVNPNLTPSVSIAASTSTTICAGTSVTFTATPTNGGTTPTYQWRKNGSNISGATSSTYTTTTLANSDVITCMMTSSETCVTTAFAISSGITMTVNTNLTPSVSIAASTGTTICSGTSVTFTATPTNGGTTPAYQWKKNGTNISGATSSTYTTTTLANNDAITCVLTSSEICVTTATATSSAITMTVNPNLTPSVAVAANPGTSICSGTSVTFTATPTNGGTTPSYQWRLNGSNISGATNSTYTSSTLSNGDIITCVLTSSETCVTSSTATSSNVVMTVATPATPSVSIAASTNTTICAGTSITFTATPTTGGTAPTYQWRLNGSNISGATNSTYTTSTLSNNDVVSCVMTSNAACITTSTATSNNITMTVNPNLTPSVSIASNQGTTICNGTSVTFTATPTNGGTTPAYQWKINGANVTGATSSTFTTTTLNNNDAVTCTITSNATCLAVATATSSAITMTVNPNLTPSVLIGLSPNNTTICAGASVTYTATPTNGGTTPAYQWRINGTNVSGATGSTFTTTTLANNDIVSCVLTSSETCVTSSTAASNNITMTVNPNLIPDVTVTATPGNTICFGAADTFSATPINGGATPTYQWFINGSVVTGATGSSFISSTLANNDVVTAVMTSSETCLTRPTDTSTALAVTVIPLTTPSVTVSALPGNVICDGGQATFNATYNNGGSSQAYQWRVNGVDITGATGSSLVTNSLSNGDVISCRLTITAACPAPATVLSNDVTMGVLNTSVAISVLPNDTLCSGTAAMFTATMTNGGANPKYQWRRNGVDMTGATAPTYTINTANNGDTITAILTASSICINKTVDANKIGMTVSQTYTPIVGITATPGTNVPNNTTIFFQSAANAINPQYQWRLNGTNIPNANSSTYTTNTLQTGDEISLVIRTNDSCATQDTALSNVLKMEVGVHVDDVANLFENVTLAPNPNNGSFVIKGKLAETFNNEEATVEVINTVGQIVYRREVMIQNNELKHNIDLGESTHQGMHMVRIHIDGRVHYVKFIIAR